MERHMAKESPIELDAIVADAIRNSPPRAQFQRR
jgi:hypothetical protein